jgi:hypothetical protein
MKLKKKTAELYQTDQCLFFFDLMFGSYSNDLLKFETFLATKHIPLPFPKALFSS